MPPYVRGTYRIRDLTYLSNVLVLERDNTRKKDRKIEGGEKVKKN